MTPTEKIKSIQEILGVTQDGHFGPKSQAALAALIRPVDASDGWTHGKASSFADPADVRAFRRCKERGGTDQECFAKGDNGIGCWGDDTSEGSGPSCALPPDEMIDRWGSVAEAKHAKVLVNANGRTIEVTLKDRMPWKKNIRNDAVIDLNPDAAKELGLDPPFMVYASWRWK